MFLRLKGERGKGVLSGNYRRSIDQLKEYKASDQKQYGHKITIDDKQKK